MNIRKMLLSITAVAFTAGNLNAINLCGEDYSIGDKVKKGSSWTKRNTKSYNLSFDTYETIKNKVSCKIFTERNDRKIVKIVKRMDNLEEPIKPPISFINAKFKYGELFANNNGVFYEKEFKDIEKFLNSFNENKGGIRIVESGYLSKKELYVLRSVCKNYGKNCYFNLTIKSNDLNENYHPRLKNSKASREMNDIVRKHKLKAILENN